MTKSNRNNKLIVSLYYLNNVVAVIAGFLGVFLMCSFEGLGNTKQQSTKICNLYWHIYDIKFMVNT